VFAALREKEDSDASGLAAALRARDAIFAELP
jgi:hypothetical protein